MSNSVDIPSSRAKSASTESTPCEGVDALWAALARDGTQFLAYGHFQLTLEGRSFDLLTENGARAASEVAVRHPRARSSYDFERGLYLREHPQLSHSASAQIFSVVGNDSSQSWEDVLVRLLTEGIPTSSESLWRIVLLRGSPEEAPDTAHVIILYDHTVGDGASMCRVFADWLAAATRDTAATSPLPSLARAPSLTRIFRAPGTRRLADSLVLTIVPKITPAFVTNQVRHTRTDAESSLYT
jgi:hypothetical protein